MAYLSGISEIGRSYENISGLSPLQSYLAYVVAR
jgi:hypothetical protein